MPLARIITTITEESLPLQEQLRARGFEVETASPGHSFAHAADLEISLEEMTPAQALARADEIAHADDLPVYISPGSISETSRPMVVVPIMPQAEAASQPPVLPEATQEDLEFDPVAFAETAETATAYAAVEAASQAETSLPPVEQIGDPVTESVYLEQLAEPSAESQGDVEPAEVAVPLAPEVQQILPELEAAMPDMEAWAHEEGPVSDWPIWQAGAIDPIELITAPPAPKIEPVRPEPRQEVRRFRRNVFASDRVFWKTAAWAAMVALSALVLGATVHRFSPIPARFANSTHPTDVKPVQNAPVADPVVVKPTAALKRTAVHESQESSPLSRPRPAASQKPQIQRRRGSSRDNIVAEDTVVRYGAKPPAPKVQAQIKSDGIKRYTDLK